jgi:hypothetical protein
LKHLAALVVVAALALPTVAIGQQLLDGSDIRNSSLTGKDVKNRSLTKSDFRGSIRGPRGLQGPQGIPGPINVSGLQLVLGPQATIPPADAVTGLPHYASSVAFCPPGQRVVSGGGSVISAYLDGLAVSEANSNRTSWFVIGGNNSDLTSGTVQAEALCAGANAAVVAKSSRRATEREVDRILAQLEANQHAAHH